MAAVAPVAAAAEARGDAGGEATGNGGGDDGGLSCTLMAGSVGSGSPFWLLLALGPTGRMCSDWSSCRRDSSDGGGTSSEYDGGAMVGAVADRIDEDEDDDGMLPENDDAAWAVARW